MTLPHMVNLGSALAPVALQGLLDDAGRHCYASIEFADHAFGVSVLVCVELSYEAIAHLGCHQQNLKITIRMPNNEDPIDFWGGPTAMSNLEELTENVAKYLAELLYHLPFEQSFAMAMERAELDAETPRGNAGKKTDRL